MSLINIDPVKALETKRGVIYQQIQHRLDAFATTRGYDNIMTACTYATSNNPKFAAEGQYCVDARDATWDAIYRIFSDAASGTRGIPTDIDAIASELPVLVWPY